MIKYLEEINSKLLENFSPELKALRDNYRENGIPTILTDGLLNLLSIVEIKRPKRILELGTSKGCSGIAMLLLDKEAKLTTVEKMEEVQREAKENYIKFGVYDRANFLLGDSLEITEKLVGNFDLVFLDCNKAAYFYLYDYIKDMLPSGGVLVADNVLFREFVGSDDKSIDKDYRALCRKIDNFNQKVINDKDMFTQILDVGDGMLISVKR